MNFQQALGGQSKHEVLKSMIGVRPKIQRPTQCVDLLRAARCAHNLQDTT